MIPAKQCVLLACAAGLSCGAQTVRPGASSEAQTHMALPPSVPVPGSGSAASARLNVLTRTTLDDKIVVLRLAPHIATSVRLPEPVNSVVIGYPECFAAEHSEGESQLVTIRPKRDEPCESNLQITTVSGKHALLDLKNLGALSGTSETVDVLLQYVTQTRGNFLEERPASSLFVAETRPLEAEMSKAPSTNKTGPTVAPGLLTMAVETSRSASPLDTLLARQEQASLPTLYGQKPGEISPGKRVRAGASDVIDNGTQVIVLFSVVNPAHHSIEILPPQVELGGIVKKKWTLGEQLPVSDYRLSARRLGPQQRVDGVAVFERPSFKQSNETLFLQIAESGAVDKPALAPIGFGISTIRGGSADVQP